MSRENQIEEMANDLYTCHDEYARDGDDWVTDYNSTAKNLYNKGYRKASDVAKEIFEEIDNILDYLKIFNSCDDILNAIVYRIAKIKKKYTEEGK